MVAFQAQNQAQVKVVGSNTGSPLVLFFICLELYGEEKQCEETLRRDSVVCVTFLIRTGLCPMSMWAMSYHTEKRPVPSCGPYTGCNKVLLGPMGN